MKRILNNIPTNWKIEFYLFISIFIVSVIFNYYLHPGGQAALVGLMFCLICFYLFGGTFYLKSKNSSISSIPPFLYSISAVTFCVGLLFHLRKTDWQIVSTNQLILSCVIILFIFLMSFGIKFYTSIDSLIKSYYKTIFYRTFLNTILLILVFLLLK